MLEYVFFHKVLADKFARYARSLDIETLMVADEPAWEVHLSEDIEDEIEEKVSEYYDELFEFDQEMYEQENPEVEGEYGAAAVEITLQNGTTVYAQTDQEIMGKVLSVLDFDELNRLMNDIVFAVENPDIRTICERFRELNYK